MERDRDSWAAPSTFGLVARLPPLSSGDASEGDNARGKEGTWLQSGLDSRGGLGWTSEGLEGEGRVVKSFWGEIQGLMLLTHWDANPSEESFLESLQERGNQGSSELEDSLVLWPLLTGNDDCFPNSVSDILTLCSLFGSSSEKSHQLEECCCCDKFITVFFEEDKPPSKLNGEENCTFFLCIVFSLREWSSGVTDSFSGMMSKLWLENGELKLLEEKAGSSSFDSSLLMLNMYSVHSTISYNSLFDWLEVLFIAEIESQLSTKSCFESLEGFAPELWLDVKTSLAVLEKLSSGTQAMDSLNAPFSVGFSVIARSQ